MHSMVAEKGRRQLALAAGRVAVIVVSLLVVYFVAPFGARATVGTYTRSAVSLVILAAVIITETVGVLRSDNPGRRAVRALTVMVSLLVVVSASIYLTLSVSDPASFTEPLGHVDALYLSMMTLTTVGFGDIGAVSSSARVAVMIQMVFNFATIGLSGKVVADRVKQSRRVATEQ